MKAQNEFVNSIINSLPGIFYIFDEDGNYIRWNRNFEKLLNLTHVEFKKENLLTHYNAENKKIIIRELHNVLKNGEAKFTAHINAGDGSHPAYYLTGVACEINGKRYIVGTGFDITDKENIDQELQKSLHEKEVLLAEIHHRVKNNLAAISGLLELETYNVKNLQATQVLINSMLRVRSIALIHEKLYQFKELSRIRMRNYVKELVQTIIKTIATDVKIDLKTEIDDIMMNVNQAIPTALILNELITNSLEHAFPNMEAGILGISFKKVKNKFYLEVYDNGIGIDPDIINNSVKTLGIKLIKTLAKQLDAELSIFSNNGTHTCLNFLPSNSTGSDSTLYE